jgi:hypothetical protein
MLEFLGQSRKRFGEYGKEFHMDRWYYPMVWFIRPVWSWMGWLLALIVIIGAISSITTTSFAVEKKIVKAVLTTEEEKRFQN